MIKCHARYFFIFRLIKLRKQSQVCFIIDFIYSRLHACTNYSNHWGSSGEKYKNRICISHLNTLKIIPKNASCSTENFHVSRSATFRDMKTTCFYFYCSIPKTYYNRLKFSRACFVLKPSFSY